MVGFMKTPGSAGPSRAWFLLPSLLLLAGVLLAGMAVSSLVGFVRTEFRAYQPDSSISVNKDGFTLYAEEGATGAADLRCTATGSGEPVRLRPVSGRMTVNNNRGAFVAIASTPEELPAGRYVISCESTSSGPDVPLYLGPRTDLAAVGRLVVFGVVAPLFLGLCSVVLFVLLAFLRHRSRRVMAAAVPPV